MSKIFLSAAAGLLVAIAAGAIVFYWFAGSHNLTARGNPSGAEAYIAGKALAMSVPAEARNRTNTVAMSEVTIAAGQSLFVPKVRDLPWL